MQLGHLSFPLLGLFFLDVIEKRGFLFFFFLYWHIIIKSISDLVMTSHKTLVIDVSLTKRKPVFVFIPGSLAREMTR